VAKGQVDGIDILQLDFPYSNKHSLQKRAWNFLRYSLSATRLAMTHDYDLLFATSTPLTAAIPGIGIRVLRKGKPFVFEVRDVWPDLPIALGGLTNPVVIRALKLLEKTAYNSADHVIGLAPGICAAIDERRSRSGPSSTLIPNGSDLELFVPLDAASNRRKFRAVYTGTHGIANGLESILACAHALKQRGRNDIELHLIGDGRQKESLVQRANAEDLTNVFFHRSMPKTQLAEVLPTYDLGLMTLSNIPDFYYGTSPNKFFDYIASGLPVVTNYPGWLADLITEHECGLAIEPDDATLFANALEQLVDESRLRSVFATNARQLAETNFGRDDLAEQFVRVLETALTDYQESHS